MPEPPPVVAPTTRTPGMSFMTDTKLLAAEKVERLAMTMTGLPQRMRPAAAGLYSISNGSEKSLWPGPVLWEM